MKQMTIYQTRRIMSVIAANSHRYLSLTQDCSREKEINEEFQIIWKCSHCFSNGNERKMYFSLINLNALWGRTRRFACWESSAHWAPTYGGCVWLWVTFNELLMIMSSDTKNSPQRTPVSTGEADFVMQLWVISHCDSDLQHRVHISLSDSQMFFETGIMFSCRPGLRPSFHFDGPTNIEE